MHNINIRTLDLNLLVVFLTLWETQSVTRASERLALSQSAVSHALRRLRERLGDELFVLGRTGLLPTSRATEIIGPVREALEKIGPVAGFRLVPGLRERVTYRELFPQGLTLFDLEKLPQLGRMQPQAREEIWAMLRALKLPSDALNRAIALPD